MKRLGKMYDIISKMDFFNQRAARELWSQKPEKIQNQDIFNRHQDLCEIKEFVDDVAELMELEEQGLLRKVEQGEWIDCTGVLDSVRQYKCSNCGSKPITNMHYTTVLSNYCPNCGAKMKELENE